MCNKMYAGRGNPLALTPCLEIYVGHRHEEVVVLRERISIVSFL